MIKIDIKPLSVNKCWKGRRFKTDYYKSYERDLMLMLPNTQIPHGKLYIEVTFGFSNKTSDIDNPLKPFLDILQKKYKFNDKDIYKLLVHKEIVKKGEEFIHFTIESVIY